MLCCVLYVCICFLNACVLYVLVCLFVLRMWWCGGAVVAQHHSRVGCRWQVDERSSVAVVLVMGTGGLAMLAFLWDATVGGHSVALLALTALAGVADTLSSVVFLPVLSHYPRACSVPFAVGEASTSLVATAIAIVQDPGEDRSLFCNWRGC